MKIIIIGPAFPLRGGIAAFNERLCQELIQLDHSCEIISYSLQYPSILFPGKTQKDENSDKIDLPIKPLINSVNPLSWWKTAKYINQQSPDLVIFRFWIPFMGPALGTIQRLLRIESTKCLALVDNLIPHENRPGDKLFTRYFTKHIDRYVVMSDSVQKDVLTFKPAAKTKLLHHPIYNQYGDVLSAERARAQLGLPMDKKVILFFGLIRKYKGLDLLLEAFARWDQKDEYILLIAGEFYELHDEYNALAESLKINKHIVWHDFFIPNEDVRYYFSAANLLVLPYRTATQSGVTQIAFHFELPVLITNVGGLGEIILHNVNGLVADPNPHSIFEMLYFYFQNEKESILRSGMKNEKPKYSWEVFCSGLLSLGSKDELSDDDNH